MYVHHVKTGAFQLQRYKQQCWLMYFFLHFFSHNIHFWVWRVCEIVCVCVCVSKKKSLLLLFCINCHVERSCYILVVSFVLLRSMDDETSVNFLYIRQKYFLPFNTNTNFRIKNQPLSADTVGSTINFLRENE